MAILIPSRSSKILIDSGGGPTPPAATYLLDDYPALEAWSSRQLISTATNSMRVRRASDNTLQDIGFVDGDLDTAALATFCAGTDGFVERLYGQMGVADAIQSTNAAQPKIYDSATGVVLENGKPAVEQTTSQYLEATFSYSNPWVFCVARYTGASPFDGNYGLVNGLPNGGNADRLIRTNSGGNLWTAGSLNDHYMNGGSEAALALPAAATQFVIFAHSTGDTGSNTSLEIGNDSTLANQYWPGTYQEVIVYTTDPIADRAAIEAEINGYYGIY